MDLDLRRDIGQRYEFGNCHHIRCYLFHRSGQYKGERGEKEEIPRLSPEETRRSEVEQRRSCSKNSKRAREVEGTPGEFMSRCPREENIASKRK